MKIILVIAFFLLMGCGVNNDSSYTERNVKNLAYAKIFIERTGQAWTLKEVYNFKTEYYDMSDDYVYRISDKGGGFFDGEERYIVVFFKANNKVSIATKGCDIEYSKNGIKTEDVTLYGEKKHSTYTGNLKKITIYWIDGTCDMRFID